MKGPIARRAKTNEERTTEQMRRAKRKSHALVEIPAARASALESIVLELCNAVWQCEITRLYALQNLDSLRIRTGTIYSGGDFIRFILDAISSKLKMVSGNKINFQFVWEFSCEKWQPAMKMAKLIYGERTLIFKKAEDLGKPKGRADAYGFSKPQPIPDCDLLIFGFYCGEFSPLYTNRDNGGDVIEFAQGESGKTWRYAMAYASWAKPALVCVENSDKFDWEQNGRSGLVEAEKDLHNNGYILRGHQHMEASTWGRDPQNRSRVYLHARVSSSIHQAPQFSHKDILAFIRPRLPTRDIEDYLMDGPTALGDCWMSKEIWTQKRQKDKDWPKDMEHCRQAYADRGLPWPPPVWIESDDDSFSCSSNPSVWGLPPDAVIILHGIKKRQAAILYAHVVRALTTKPQPGTVTWFHGEMSWKFSKKSPENSKLCPTLTSKSQFVLLHFPSNGQAPQLRWLSPVEAFHLQGCKLSDILSSAQFAGAVHMFSRNELTRLAGQSFHFPSCAYYVLAALLEQRLCS